MHLSRLLFLLVAPIIMTSYSAPKKPQKVLVFSKTAGYRHKEAIVAGKKEIPLLGLKNKFIADTTENADVFTCRKFKTYSRSCFFMHYRKCVKR